MFSYDDDAVHRVIVSHACRSCILPELVSQERHLRAVLHRFLGAIVLVNAIVCTEVYTPQVLTRMYTSVGIM